MHKGFVGVAFLGLIVSGYLFIHYVSPEPIACISGEGCKIAQLSVYSSFLGIPTPAYGVLFYLGLGVLGALWSSATKKKLLPFLVLLVGSGLAVSIFLSSMEAFVLHAWCSWCVASAVLVIVASGMTLDVLFNSKRK